MHRLSILRKQRRPRAQTLVGGTWNTRKLGAFGGVGDPEMKIQCILTLLAVRGWSYGLLSDLAFAHNGVR
eukprot:7881959-Pyramimonas_sp.AAC.1